MPGRHPARGSGNLAAVDDPAVTRPRGQRVRDETASLGVPHELAQGRVVRYGGEVDLERGLDVDERVEAVGLALRHRAVRPSDALRVEPRAPRGVVQAR